MMRNAMAGLLVVLACGVGIAGDQQYRGWSVATGAGYGTGDLGLSLMHSQVFGLQKVSARVLLNHEVEVFESSPEVNGVEVAMLYGVHLRPLANRRASADGHSPLHVSVAAGLAVVSGTTQGELLSTGPFVEQYAAEPYTVTGFPVQIECTYAPLANFGIGLVGYADWNEAAPFAGLMLCVSGGSY